jgi:hypothetical protein
MDDGYKTLADEHRSLEEQFQELLRDEEAPVVRELVQHLSRHLDTEEAAIHPSLRRYVDGGDDLADRATQEHSALSTMLAELQGSTTPDHLTELLVQLGDALHAHVEFVESEVFEEMRSCGVDGAAVAAGLGPVDSAAS